MVLKYNIYWSLTPDGPWNLVNDTPFNGTRLVIPGLKMDVVYYLKIVPGTIVDGVFYSVAERYIAIDSFKDVKQYDASAMPKSTRLEGSSSIPVRWTLNGSV